MATNSGKEVRHAAGAVLIAGLGGMELSGLERAWLRLIRPAGIILFRRNIATADQTRTLLAESTALCASEAFRCVDIEGGPVDRLRDAVAPMPSAQAVAKAEKSSLMRKHGSLIAREVQAFGFNTTLAPVLDLALPESASVMGTRVVSADPAKVTAYAHEFFAGLGARGVMGCAKHFPGLGGGTLDSHESTPVIERTWEQIWKEDLMPYRDLQKKLPMVMVNHAAYPRTRGGETPASVSRFWITKVLRERLNYRGLIFSDDFEMGGILKHLPIEDASIEALLAGIDLIEVCHSPELIMRSYTAIRDEAERSVAFRRVLLKAARRVSSFRKKNFVLPVKSVPVAQLAQLRELVLQFRKTIDEAQPA